MEGKGILHTIYVCLLYFVFGSVFFLAPTIDIYKHNMGIMVLQTRLPLTGIFKQAFYDIVYTGVVCRFWKQISLLYNSSAMSPGQRRHHRNLGIICRTDP